MVRQQVWVAVRDDRSAIAAPARLQRRAHHLLPTIDQRGDRNFRWITLFAAPVYSRAGVLEAAPAADRSHNSGREERGSGPHHSGLDGLRAIAAYLGNAGRLPGSELCAGAWHSAFRDEVFVRVHLPHGPPTDDSPGGPPDRGQPLSQRAAAVC